MNNQITLTKSALSMIDEIMVKQNLDKSDNFIRVGVKSGGCSGNQYMLEFVDLTEIDSQLDKFLKQENNINVVIDNDSMEKLSGLTIDYVSTIEGEGFKFNNPNMQRGCGCGKSYC